MCENLKFNCLEVTPRHFHKVNMKNTPFSTTNTTNIHAFIYIILLCCDTEASID